MTTITPDVTLAELVIARPELAPRFDNLGLDYCCGGQNSLRAAAAVAGLDLDTVIAQLNETPVEAVNQQWEGIDGLVDHLESTHHAYLREALPRLVELGDKVASVHGESHPELIAVAALVEEIASDLMPHLMKEEQVLFPMIRQLAVATEDPSFHCGSLANPIQVMTSEHDTLGDLLAQLRWVSNGYEVPADGCASYHALYSGLNELESDTHQHVHKENNVLFPAVADAEQALTARTQ